MCTRLGFGGWRRGCSRKGAIVVLVALALVILFAAAAFSVDIAYMFLAEEQLHAATDAAAKAAVVSLSQGSDQHTATNTAISYAAANVVCGKPLTITADNVSLGKVAYSQSGLWSFVAAGTPTAAAQVKATVSVPLFFAPLLGTATFSPIKTSTAAFVRNKWCFVFDRSGSMCFDMSGNDWNYPAPVGYYYGYPYGRYSWWPYYTPDATQSRLANLRTGAKTFLTTLTNAPGGTAQNQVAMITFGDSAATDCTFSSNYSPITNRLNYYLSTNIWQDGIENAGTNLAAGLQAAFNLFASPSTNDGTPWNKIIIVFSDGQWNEGSDPLTLVPQATSAGITIHTVGLLQQSNNNTMQQLPAQTGGKFFYATSGAQLQAAFQKLAETIPVILTQ